MEARPLQPDSARLGGLSDGVFAIVLTLLVLDLKVPASLSHTEQLTELLMSFGSFTVTFVAMALLWVSHNRIFSTFSHIDRRIQYLNLAFLFPLSLLPFLTAFLAKYPLERLVQELYGLCMIALGVLLWAIWQHGIRQKLVDRRIDARTQRYLLWRGLDGTLVFVVWCLLALFQPRWTFYAVLLLPVSGWLIARRFPKEDALDEA